MNASLAELLRHLCDFDTALIANTIEYIDPTPPHEYYMGGSIASVTPTLGPTVGVAVTCEVDSSTPAGRHDFEKYFEMVDRMALSPEPKVLVAKAVGSRPDHECILGDGMAKLLNTVGCVGIVTDGGVRDVEGLLTVPFAAYCRGRTIHHCAIQFLRTGVPVEIGGIVIAPGDVIHANAGGVVKVPRACLESLSDRAAEMQAFEHRAHAIFRLPGVPAKEKSRRIGELLGKAGFGR